MGRLPAMARIVTVAMKTKTTNKGKPMKTNRSDGRTYTKLWLAHFETPNFTFNSYGSTRDEAILALREGWNEHSVSYAADPDYLSEFIDDVDCYEITALSCYRDGEQIAKAE